MRFPKIKLTGINALNLVGAVVIFYLLVVLTQTVRSNYALGKQIELLNAQISLLKDQKEQLTYSIAYYNTDSFREREARSKLGLQLPGENVVIIPRSSSSTSTSPDKVKSAAKRSNLEQWFDFFGGRG